VETGTKATTRVERAILEKNFKPGELMPSGRLAGEGPGAALRSGPEFSTKAIGATRELVEGLKELGFDRGARRALYDSIKAGDPIAIVGDDMGRVRKMQKLLGDLGIDAKTYETRTAWRSDTRLGIINKLDEKRDVEWLRRLKNKDATFIDIQRSPDPLRLRTGHFYLLEEKNLYQTWKYQKILQIDPGF